MLAVNCAAIPEQLLESELFGHERGAFTGAFARKIGRFEVCDGGTLFLDEIGELSLATQTKLLRVLQEKEFERLGGSTPISVDIRLIAATNRDLRAMIAAEKFREDLFYRLNVASIDLPPLRERKEDIPLLVEYFIGRFAAEYGDEITVSSDAIRALRDYDWPGNVRELENVLKNSLVRVNASTLLPSDLRLGEAGGTTSKIPLGPRSAPAPPVAIAPRERDLDGLMHEVFGHVRRMREQGEKEDAFDLVERRIVRDALVHAQGNQVKAAKLLGITRSTLRKRMVKYGIQIRTQVESGGN
jgi:transcriptional regulator with GAF, ATPase, and Fis domain